MRGDDSGQLHLKSRDDRFQKYLGGKIRRTGDWLKMDTGERGKLVMAFRFLAHLMDLGTRPKNGMKKVDEILGGVLVNSVDRQTISYFGVSVWKYLPGLAEDKTVTDMEVVIRTSVMDGFLGEK